MGADKLKGKLNGKLYIGTKEEFVRQKSPYARTKD